MNSRYSRRIAAWAVFIIGFCLMLLGIALLLRHIRGFSGSSAGLSFLFLLAGFVFALAAIKLRNRPMYIFIAAFILMVGSFVLLAALGIIQRAFLFSAWPLISVFSGVALLPAGWRYYGGLTTKYLVPSCAFIALGSILLVFSLDIVTISFKQFILDWWPLLIMLAGIILALIALGVRNNPGDRGE